MAAGVGYAHRALKGALLAAVACALFASAGCAGDDSPADSAHQEAYAADEVQTALRDVGVEFDRRVDSSALSPSELGASDPGRAFTLLSGAIRDPTSEAVNRYGIQVYVYGSANMAKGAENDLRTNPDDFRTLHRRFRNVLVLFWDFTRPGTPTRLPPIILDAMNGLGSST